MIECKAGSGIQQKHFLGCSRGKSNFNVVQSSDIHHSSNLAGKLLNGEPWLPESARPAMPHQADPFIVFGKTRYK